MALKGFTTKARLSLGHSFSLTGASAHGPSPGARNFVTHERYAYAYRRGPIAQLSATRQDRGGNSMWRDGDWAWRPVRVSREAQDKDIRVQVFLEDGSVAEGIRKAETPSATSASESDKFTAEPAGADDSKTEKTSGASGKEAATKTESGTTGTSDDAKAAQGNSEQVTKNDDDQQVTEGEGKNGGDVDGSGKTSVHGYVRTVGVDGVERERKLTEEEAMYLLDRPAFFDFGVPPPFHWHTKRCFRRAFLPPIRSPFLFRW